MKIQVVTTEGGVLQSREFDGIEEFLSVYSAPGGFVKTVQTSGLSGPTRVIGLLGPMHGGPDMLRYEDQAAYNILSS